MVAGLCTFCNKQKQKMQPHQPLWRHSFPFRENSKQFLFTCIKCSDTRDDIHSSGPAVPMPTLFTTAAFLTMQSHRQSPSSSSPSSIWSFHERCHPFSVTCAHALPAAPQPAPCPLLSLPLQERNPPARCRCLKKEKRQG